MSSSKTIIRMAGIWLLFLVVYAGISLVLPRGSHALTAFGDLTQCIVPLLANAGLLLNAGTPHWRRNLFWMLLAMGCTLWMIGQFQWTYYELYLHRDMPDNDPVDIVFFLRGIPMMAALTLRPHLKRGELRLRFGYLDFALLLSWWIFLYIFIVLPWMYAVPSLAEYNYNYVLLHNIENMIIVGGFGYLWLRSSGAWRVVYANLFGASAMYMLSSLTINIALEFNRYYTGSLYDLPMVSSFLWFALAGFIAYQKRAALDAPSENDFDSESEGFRGESVVPARLAMAAVMSLPLFAIFTLRFAHENPAVRDFRLLTVLLASIPLALLVFLRTYLADADRTRLLSQSERSIENLQRLQAQIVQSEKLVSLGQLAAGAAHEINNPLTAILGFSDLLADDFNPSRKSAPHGVENSRPGSPHENTRRESAQLCQAGPHGAHASGHQHGGDQRRPTSHPRFAYGDGAHRAPARIGSPGRSRRWKPVDAGLLQYDQQRGRCHGSGARRRPYRQDHARSRLCRCALHGYRAGCQGASPRFRSFLYDEAGRKRHRPGSQHLLRHRAGAQRQDCLLQPARRWRRVSRGVARCPRGFAHKRIAPHRFYLKSAEALVTLFLVRARTLSFDRHDAFRTHVRVLFRTTFSKWEKR